MSETAKAAVTADELLEIAIRTSCEAVRARDALLELRDAADTMAENPPANETAIRLAATAFKIPVRHRQIARIVMNLTDVLLDDVSNPGLRVSKTILTLAPERDLADWERRGVLPCGAYHEAAQAMLLAREGSGDADVLALQLERCQLALAYPAGRTLHIARAALTNAPRLT